MRLDVDAIFDAFNSREVEYILIGGMNFLLRHQPVLTFDVDVWIHDTAENRTRCEAALNALDEGVRKLDRVRYLEQDYPRFSV
ncbi:MAG TPA: hypothetical protein PKE12_08285 [Kiritimatiellia bacterium]|nr:hypothetical protein [Kiritimatiellia bacterium]